MQATVHRTMLRSSTATLLLGLWVYYRTKVEARKKTAGAGLFLASKYLVVKATGTFVATRLETAKTYFRGQLILGLADAIMATGYSCT